LERDLYSKLEARNAAWPKTKVEQELKDHSYPTIKAAKRTKWFKKHKNIQANINTLKRHLKDDWLEKTIAEFHKTVHTAEVDRKLRGIRPADIITPPTFKYKLKKRGKVAKLLLQAT
jgi:uncharacterized protein YfaS (alpha-2-macroglobulin family)